MLRAAPSLIALVALTCFGATTSAAAATVTVCPTAPVGCDHATVQAGVNAAGSGGVVNVAAGTYTEEVHVTLPVTINGAQVGVDARGRVAGETLITNDAGPAFVLEAPATLDGLSLNYGGVVYAAIDGADALTLRNSIVRAGAFGITVEGSGSEAVTVERSDVEVPKVAVVAVDLAGLAIADSRVNVTAGTTTGAAIDPDDVAAVTIERSTISATGNATTGIRFRSGTAASVRIVDNNLLAFDPALRLTAPFTSPSIALNRNRIVRARSTDESIITTSSSDVDATDNWWACASTPSTSGRCDVIDGSGGAKVVRDRFLVPYASLAAGSAGATVPLVVGVRRQDGTEVPGGALPAFAGVPIEVASTTGAVGAASGLLAPTSFTTTVALPSDGGEASATATLDHVVAKSNVVTVIGPAPTPLTTTRLVGTAYPGATLNCVNATWTGGTDRNVNRSWTRNGTAVVPNSSTYTVVPSDVGATIACVVTHAAAFREPSVSSASTVVKKRKLVLTSFAATAKGVKLKCGAASTKACVVPKTGFTFAQVGAKPAAPSTKVDVVAERKVGRKWVKAPGATVVLKAAKDGSTGATVKLFGSKLGVGLLRVRAQYKGNASDLPAKSGYTYLLVR